MASKKRVSHDDRVKMVVLRDEGYSLQEIASKLKCNVVQCAEPLQSRENVVQWMIERDLEDQEFQRPEMIVLCRGFAFTIEDLLVLI